MATYSPISTRTNQIRRRESLSSSIGATSVRRLIAVMRPPTTSSRPPLPRRILLFNLLSLSLSHLLSTAAHLPFLVQQGAVSAFSPPLTPTHYDIGPSLLALACFCAAIGCLLAPSILRKAGLRPTLALCHFLLAIYYACHLESSLYLLVPVAVVGGVTLGVLVVGQSNCLMTLAFKVSDEEDEGKVSVRRTCVVRRMARAVRAGQDFGVMVGSLVTALVVGYVGVGEGEWGGWVGNGTWGNGSGGCADLRNCSG